MLVMFKDTLPDNIVAISSTRAVSYDKEIKLRHCKADVSLDNDTSSSLLYSVQVDEEDTDNFYVELDSDSLGTIAQQATMRQLLKNK